MPLTGTASLTVAPLDADRLLLLDLLRRQPLLAAINLTVASLAVLLVLRDQVPGGPLAAWLIGLAGVQGVRLALWLGLRSQHAHPLGEMALGWLLTALAVATGLCWGLAGVLFGVGDRPSAQFVPFLLAGMSAGAVTALPGHAPSFFAFVWAALLPYACRLAGESGPLAPAMALTTLLYAVGLSAVGYQVHRSLRQAAGLHSQNAELVRRLDLARQELEARVASRTVELQNANDALSAEVAERRRSEARVRHLLAHDALTNLPNRILLFDRLEAALARCRRFGGRAAVLVFDVDRFKAINDHYGHPLGDLLLRELAERVRSTIRATDTAARLGGDEFAIVSPDMGEPGKVEILAQRLLEACARPFHLGEQQLEVSISIGAALYPEHGEQSDALLRAADAALYAAKAEGRGRFTRYSRTLHAVVEGRRRLERDLREAARAGQFRLLYQPRYVLADRRLVAVEALLRWEHPVLGTLAPDRFIDVAQASGQMREIGRWVLDRACAQSRAWRDAGRPLCVAVNLSPAEFRQPQLAQQVGRCLAETGLDPSLLELEIGESVCLERDGAAVTPSVTELKRLGVRLAIDNFGTGYTSLAYLKWLPFDVLKVDGSFIGNVDRDPRDEAIVTTIVALARRLDKIVVAEAVENADQLATLARLGCHQAQGFLLGRPAPAEAIDLLLAA
ncbi:MAG: EAL domain-containing protein [Geminicoccaceae bacterium]